MPIETVLFKDQQYPKFQTNGNAMRFCLPFAKEVVTGDVIFDIGCGKDEWKFPGVGIVASRITERYNRPALVASIDEEKGIAGGSARSIPNFNLLNGMDSVADVFLTHGGHAAAAGFSLEVSRIDEAAQRLNEYARSVLTDEDLIPTFYADAEINADELVGKAILELEKLQPFGTANEAPRFIVRGTKFTSRKPCGDGTHIQFRIKTTHELRGIAFRMSHLFEQVGEDETVDLLVKTQMDTYNGYNNPKLELISMERSLPNQ
jgi:single-stranded-DNA-specific exonuclease